MAALLLSATSCCGPVAGPGPGWALPPTGRLEAAVAGAAVGRRWPVVAAVATSCLQVLGWQQAAGAETSPAAPTASPAAPTASFDGLAELLNGQLVYAVTDENGSPALEPDPERSGKFVGRFYMDPKAAEQAFERIKKDAGFKEVKLELRSVPLADVYLPIVINGDEKELGGQLRLEPIFKEVRHAQQMLDGMSIGEPGTVPLFMAKELELQGAEPGSPRFTPAFLYEKDLRTSLKRAGAAPQAKGGPKVQVTTLKTLTDLYIQSGEKAPRVRLVDSTDFIKDIKSAPATEATAAAK